ncbi:hypothetical protein FHT39_000350 [Mitsuaria sp. BK045]|uniref:hypothetical protein n=1 Tax=unclassified Roseateles TaxID=2626991 RepID=UPI00161A861B|nr:MULTISPECIES: hypothetical protein [unclassified Roseateles]MBB3291711.1 hypothetical protein [Mitsuaria sp. BK041]MBB3360928.1 hypothetical protein [Mitsuaria sp. BK045]
MSVEMKDGAELGADEAGAQAGQDQEMDVSGVPNATLPSPTSAANAVQAASSSVPAVTMQVALAVAPGLVKAEMATLFNGWINGTHPATVGGPDEVAWFMSKKATALINKWLGSKNLAMLHLTKAELGPIVIARDRVEHARHERTTEDGVSIAGVEELMAALFIHGTPKYAPHHDTVKYPNQLLMFDPSYKGVDATVSGESPVAALQWVSYPEPHFRLETAYWANPGKTKKLDQRALKK